MLYDRDIREPLFEFLEGEFGKIRILEEKKAGKSRADVVMVTEDALYGIEIKSDADTYARLSSQVKDYNRYYDFNCVACGTRHAGHIREHVPEWWGIITVDETENGPDFYWLRRPAKNPKMKLKHKITLLWRGELARIQERNGMYKYREKSKKFVQEKILEKLDEEVIQREISAEMFERDYTLIESEISEYRAKHRG